MKNYIKPIVATCFNFEEIALEEIKIPGEFEGASIFDEAFGEDAW